MYSYNHRILHHKHNFVLTKLRDTHVHSKLHNLKSRFPLIKSNVKETGFVKGYSLSSNQAVYIL